jgi:hypothetical protein
MNKAMPWLIVTLLMSASVWTISHAVADEMAAHVNGEVNALARERFSSGLVPSAARIAPLEADLKLVKQLAPANGMHQASLMRLYLTPQQVSVGVDVVRYDQAFNAAGAFAVRQPASGYAWASVLNTLDAVHAQGLLAGGMPLVERGLGNAFRYGQHERNVLITVLDVGFANYPALTIESQRSLSTAIHHLALRHPDDVFALAAKRGMVDSVCAESRMVKLPACKSHIAKKNAQLIPPSNESQTTTAAKS